MTFGKVLALAAGFLGALVLGVWIGAPTSQIATRW